MSHSSSNWEQTFTGLFHASVERYHQGHQKASGLVDAQGHVFLKSIGYTEQEFFDFVEDFSRDGQPTPQTALKIAAVRRDYFLEVQKGKPSTHQISMDTLPPKDAEVEGIVWLPRILPKAEAKLRGEMPPDLMYGCGGDRKFFATNQIDPAEFLRRVWKAHGNHSEVISWVKAAVKK
ncbi:MAG: DUF5069 domain-containing protein [Methylacidiphilales bacterium]|nr:DUF5069 domain-containing protein [Candidatus Methylacidiphilales bacterium]